MRLTKLVDLWPGFIIGVMVSGTVWWYLDRMKLLVPSQNWLGAVFLAGFGALSVALAWPIRAWNSGDRSRKLDPLHAARVVAFARACSRAGSALAGWFLGQAITLLPYMAIDARRERLWIVLLSVAASAITAGCGLVAERWCRIGEDSDDADGLDVEADRA